MQSVGHYTRSDGTTFVVLEDLLFDRRTGGSLTYRFGLDVPNTYGGPDLGEYLGPPTDNNCQVVINEGQEDFDNDGLVDACDDDDDDDGDGMSDAFEDANGLNSKNPGDSGLDADSDGLTNLEEFTLETDPNDPDSDSGGIGDGVDPNPSLFDNICEGDEAVFEDAIRYHPHRRWSEVAPHGGAVTCEGPIGPFEPAICLSLIV